MTTANKARGEVVFSVSGKSYKMRPTFDALAKIEEISGKGFFEFVTTISTKTIKLPHLRDILIAGVEGAGGQLDEKTAGELILDFGVVEFVNGPFAEFIGRAAGYYEKQKPAKKGDAGK